MSKLRLRTVLVLISILCITLLWVWYQQTYWDKYTGLSDEPSETSKKLQESAQLLQEQLQQYQLQLNETQDAMLKRIESQTSSTATTSTELSEKAKASLLQAAKEQINSTSSSTEQ